MPPLIYPILLYLLLYCTGCGPSEPTPAAPPDRPNILFILVDDLGAHDLGATGSRIYETPHVDRIASRGTYFTTGYANSAVCSPSRASLMSGRYVTEHGVTDWIGALTGTDWRRQNRANKSLPAEYVHQLKPELTSLPEALRAQSYRTFFAGKWHLGSAEQQSLPTDHGFDINVGGYEAGSPSGGYFSPFDNPYLPNVPAEAGMNLSEKLARETADFLDQRDTTPFFAMLSFYAVHGPIQTSEAKWRKYRDKIVAAGVADRGFTMERMLPIRLAQDDPIYGGLVEQMDDAVGIVLDKLDALGLADNTIVVFTSDNGGVASGDNYSTNNAPLRGGKGYQWEGGTRVPLFVYVPWLEAAPDTVDTPVMGIDIYPTLVDLAGGPAPDSIDGVSLVPLLHGETLPARPLYWHYPHYGNQGGEPNSTIREGNYKLIHYWEDDRRELYDLGNDPTEQTDIAQEQPEVLADLDRQLTAWLDRTQARLPTPDPLYDPAAEEAVYQRFATEKMPELEQLRKDRLSPDYWPNADWWGSAARQPARPEAN